MTTLEFQSYFEDVLEKLWPKWKTNDAQVSTWAKALKYFSYSAVRRASEEHFTSQEGSYGKPKLYAIIEKARLYQPKNTNASLSSDSASADKFEPDVFIQCVENEKFPARVFSFHPVIVLARFREDRDYIMNAAENMRSRCESLYAGRWITLQQTSYKQMYNQLAEHRANNPKPKPQSQPQPQPQPAVLKH